MKAIQTRPSQSSAIDQMLPAGSRPPRCSGSRWRRSLMSGPICTTPRFSTPAQTVPSLWAISDMMLRPGKGSGFSGSLGMKRIR